MKKSLVLVPLLGVLVGCAGESSYVRSDTTLGRVVVYRNGIAYFERTARVDGDTLKLAVPADKVDDFLKSLTVVDAKTGQPAPIAYPTSAQGAAGTGLIDMTIGLQGNSPHDLKLTYVTEAPSWKPSYRMVIGANNKVSVQAWAIVDNTSGEDWRNVQLGVGSSSALSFRFDLRSIRSVQRETLRSDSLFAIAPPMGGATVGQEAFVDGRRVLAEMSAGAMKTEESIALATKEHEKKAMRYPQAPAKTPMSDDRLTSGGLGSGAGKGGRGAPPARPPMEAPPASAHGQAQAQVGAMNNLARQLQRSQNTIVVEGYADASDGDKNAASLEWANKAREQLIRNGVDASKVVAVGRGEQPGRGAGVRFVETAGVQGKMADGQGTVGKLGPDGRPAATEPIGASHFESKVRMSVPRGTSAMVSILNTQTAGEVVYLFDPEGVRGDKRFAFKAVRIKNPTDSVLESGPVTVFGEGKFIGEGLADPIPARSTAFIPFALDRQIVVEKKEAEVDRIARIITVVRGVFSTEMQHTKKTTFVLHNRLGEKATVFVRHSIPEGYKLQKPAATERLGSAHLFPVEIAAGAKAEITIEEATPVFKSADIRSPAGLDLVTAYLSSAALDGPLKGAVADLLKLHKEMAHVEQQIGTTREAQAEYRARMDELHAQIVTLRAVRTAGPLMQNLEKKLAEVSDKLSKSTIEVVGLQEKLMVSRIRFQDGVADLSLEPKSDKRPTSDAPSKAASRD